MHPSAIKVDIDPDVVAHLISKRLDEELKAQIHWVDIERLEQMTSMNYRFLHDNFLKHPSVRQFERTKSRKKYFKYPEVMEAINELMEKW